MDISREKHQIPNIPNILSTKGIEDTDKEGLKFKLQSPAQLAQ